MTNLTTQQTTQQTTTNKPSLAIIARRSIIALAATGILVLSGNTASAKKISNIDFGAWKGGAYSSNQTGAFSHCAASAKYKSGTELLFSVTKSGQWTMGMANNKWNLITGNRYDIRFQVDGGQILRTQAKARKNTLVQILLPKNSKLFSHFRHGDQLKVKAAKQLFRFNLTGTDKMLKKLVRCAAYYRSAENSQGLSDGVRNPFQPATVRSID